MLDDNKKASSMRLTERKDLLRQFMHAKCSLNSELRLLLKPALKYVQISWGVVDIHR